MRIIKNISFVIFTALLLSSCGSSKESSTTIMVAVMEVQEPIKGACNNDYIVAVLPLPGNGQIKAVPPRTKQGIMKELNSRVEFLKGKSDYQDKGSVNIIINCRGELLRCKIDNKSQSPELDKQIVAVFNEMKLWTAGSIKGKSVDSSIIYSFTITNGVIAL